LSLFKIIKIFEIALAIIKSFCRGILSKYCVVAVYSLSVGAVAMSVRYVTLHISTLKGSYLGSIFDTRGHLESKERFAIKKYLLIIGKKNVW
jgi:hypothetical protein